MAITLADAVVNITGDDGPLGPVFQRVNQKTQTFVGGLAGSILKLGTGAVIAGVGATVTAVGAIGTAAFGASSQVDEAAKKIESQLGGMQTGAHDFGELIKEVYGNNFGDSIADVGQALADTSQNMDRFGEMSDEELRNATERALALRDAFDIDVGESTNAANALMENFGLSADEAFDFVQSGLQNGLNSSGDFLDTIGEYSVQFADADATAAEFFSVMDTGLQSGMLGTDKAADLFKEFRLRIQDGSDSTAEALASIGLSVDDIMQGLDDGSLTVMDVFSDVQRGINSADSETDAFQAGVALMGSQFEDLGKSAVGAIDPLALTMEDISSLQSDINTQYDTWGSFVEGMKRKAQVGLMPLGDMLLTMAESTMPLIEDAFAWFEETLVPMLETGAQKVQEFLDTFLGKIEDGQSPLDAFKDTLNEFLPPEVVENLRGFAEFVSKVREFLEKHGDKLLEVLLGVGAALAAFSIISTVVGWIGGLITAVGTISAAFTASGGVIAGIVALLGGPVTIVIAAVAGAIGLFAAAWAGDWGGIRSTLDIAWQAIKAIWNAMVEWVQETLMPKIREFRDKWRDEWWPAIQEAVEAAWSKIQEIWTSIQEGFDIIKEKVRETWQKWQENWDKIKEKVIEVAEPITTFVDKIKDFADWLRSNVLKLSWDFGSMPDWVQTLINFLRGGGGGGGATTSSVQSSMGIQAFAGLTAGGAMLPAAASPGLTVVFHRGAIDARGAAPGVENGIESAVRRVLREEGRRAENMMRGR